MLKKVFGLKFSRNTNSRKALFRGLLSEVILRGSIVTTKKKAQAIQKDLEKLCLLANEDTLNGRRIALSLLGNNREACDALFESFRKLKLSKRSGFSKITSLNVRRGDSTQMARISLVDFSKEKTTEDKKDDKSQVSEAKS